MKCPSPSQGQVRVQQLEEDGWVVKDSPSGGLRSSLWSDPVSPGVLGQITSALCCLPPSVGADIVRPFLFSSSCPALWQSEAFLPTPAPSLPCLAATAVVLTQVGFLPWS